MQKKRLVIAVFLVMSLLIISSVYAIAPVISDYVRTPSGDQIYNIIDSGDQYTHVRINYKVSDNVTACRHEWEIGATACYEEQGCDADHGYLIAPLVLGMNTISIDCWNAQGEHATYTDVVEVIEKPECVSDDDCFSTERKYCENSNACSSTITSNCVEGKCVTSVGEEACTSCEYGCRNGECLTEVPPEPICVDSDGGKNYYVKGLAEVPCLPGEPCPLCSSICSVGEPCALCAPQYDWCADESILVEGYCEGAYVLYEEYICPNGCQNGRCYYPGFFMDADKDVYYQGDVITLYIRPASYLTKTVVIDLYVMDPGYNNKEFIKQISISGDYKIGIETSRSIFSTSGHYLLLLCDGGAECLGGTNTNSISVRYEPKEVGCVSDNDCPSEEKRYCEGSNACTSTTYYACVNGECVASGGGGGCYPCRYSCENGACIGEPPPDKCEKYYTCSNGNVVKYCWLTKEYDEKTNMVVGEACTCVNPESLCREVPPPPPPPIKECAAKIRITSEKDVYYFGDYARIEVEIFDSKGNKLPYYAFYGQIYTYSDGRWHTPSQEKTDKNGYYTSGGRIDGSQVGKIKFKVYTPNTEGYADCNSVEDVIEIEIRKREEPEPVCGNRICEPGEGEICIIAAMVCEEGRKCEIPKPYCKLVCPEDCGEETIFANIGEKFKLRINQKVKFKEYKNFELKLNDITIPRCAPIPQEYMPPEGLTPEEEIKWAEKKAREIYEEMHSIVRSPTYAGGGGGSITESITGGVIGILGTQKLTETEAIIARKMEETKMIIAPAPVEAVAEEVEEAIAEKAETITTAIRCVGGSPYAIIEVKGCLGERCIAVKNIRMRIALGEKRRIEGTDELTIIFLDYDRESGTGLFDVEKVTDDFRDCPENCKCDIDGNIIKCWSGDEDCPTGTILCPDGTCRKSCEIGDITTECKFGCFYGGKCLPIGVRVKGMYCSVTGDLLPQAKEGGCDNNFECESNICIADECLSKNFLQKIIDWLKRFFGIGPRPPKVVECSKLLIEKNIGDYKYVKSEYGGAPEFQAPIFSDEGVQIDTVKCCVAIYKDQNEKRGMAIVCPYNNRQYVETLIKQLPILNKNFVLGEYKGQKVIQDRDISWVWTHNTYAIATGREWEQEGSVFPEDIVDAYLKRYPSDLDITEED